MNKEIIEKVQNLIGAYSCCKEAKDAANAYLSAIGTDEEKTQAKKLVAELEEDIMPIDGLISFSASDMTPSGQASALTSALSRLPLPHTRSRLKSCTGIPTKLSGLSARISSLSSK